MPAEKNTKDSDFLDGVLKTLSLKSKPKLPKLDDPRWSEYFDSTFPERRETLSQTWFRCVDIYVNQGKTQPINNLGETIFHNRVWLAKLQPYITSSHVWQTVFHQTPLHVAHILAGVSTDDEASQVLRKLWFGNEQEKLEGLLQAGEISKKCRLTMYMKTFVAELAWQIAELPSAGRTHKVAACIVSYWSGYLFGPVELLPHDEARAWYYLGTYTKGGDQFDPARLKKPEHIAYYETIKDLPAFTHRILQHSYPEAMTQVFPQIFSFAKKKRDGHILTSQSMLGHICPPDCNVYKALAHWIPAHAGVIQMAELSGLSLEETIDVVNGLAITGNLTAKPLPEDFNPQTSM